MEWGRALTALPTPRTLPTACSHPWRILRSTWTSAEGLIKILTLTQKLGLGRICFTGLPRFIAFCFVVYQILRFYKGKVGTTLCPARLSAPFFQKHLLTLCSCVTFWSFSQYLKRLFYYCLLQGLEMGDYDLWKLR